MDPGEVGEESTGAGDAARRPSDRRARSMRRRTEERLLEGAMRAVAARGLAKLGMSDVGEFAGVSRGTVYRYFPNTEALLTELGRREAANFERQVWKALEKVPSGEERLRVTLGYLGKLAQEHPLIQRLPETDPGFVLSSIRERFPEIRETFERLLVPVLEDNSLVRQGVVSPEQLAGWTARMMISLFLFPETDPEEAARSLASAFRILAQSPAEAEAAPESDREPSEDERARNQQPRHMRRG